VTGLADLSQVIREARKVTGLTQEAAAHLCGVSMPFMNQLEQGSRPGMSITKVLAVCDGLGIRLHAQVPGDPDGR
jgi:HTH-type transcriptional regulator/antitoxin HipB